MAVLPNTQPVLELSCGKKKNGACGCAPPTNNLKTAIFYFLMALLGGGLLVIFDTVRGYQQDALQVQNLGMVLVLGFLTGLHCIGMCGGFMMSYIRYGKKISMSEFEMHFRYGVAKILSYSFFGGLFGLLGSFVYFSLNIRSIISLLGGIFLLYLGAKGLGVFVKIKPWAFLVKLQNRSDQISSPTSVGLLKGLMISCAPLQALYLIAASYGDPVKGAIMLGVFGAGTLPIFLFYGVFVGSLNRFQAKWADVITAGILVIFGILMINRGIALSGFSLSNTMATSIMLNPEKRLVSASTKEICEESTPQLLKMMVDKKGWGKKVIHFEYGKKARWEIDVKEITMCNRELEIPALGISKRLKKGLNVIEFNPGKHQTLVYTCWMGMLKGELKAKSD